MKKLSLSFMLLVGGILMVSHNVQASEQEMVYDLDNHALLETVTLEEDGEPVEVSVMDTSLFSRVADKTYTISKSKKNAWSISYKATIKNNQFTSASGGNFKAIQGNFSNTSVTKQSGTLAIGKGSWKYRAATSVIQVKASISNKKLTVN